MADSESDTLVLLPACRELFEAHPESARIREQVEALERAMPDSPGEVVSFCRVIIETTCKTILTDREIPVRDAWEPQKLVSETLKCLDFGLNEDGSVDATLQDGAKKLVRGLYQIVQGIVEIRNVHGSAAHGADAYSPLLDARYAEILVRATDAVVGLLFKTHLGPGERDPLMRFQYGDHGDFDEFIDDNFGPFEVLEVPVIASAALYWTDREAYRAALVQFRQDRAGSKNAEESEE